MILLRSAALNATYVAVTLTLSIYGALTCRTEQDSLRIGQIWGRVMVAAARRLAGIEVHIDGAENLPRSGPALIACQHQSAFDTMLWMTLLPGTAFILKQELIRLPLFGPLLLMAGMIPVDRSAGAAALRGAIRGAANACAKGRQIVIFPEGRRVAPGTRAVPLQPGVAAIAAATGLPVIPATIDSGLRWPRQGFIRRPGIVRVRVFPALQTGLRRDALLRNLTGIYDARPGN
jgi:1-acyl-sn-glycerol-3-phosphate acyltransferase